MKRAEEVRKESEERYRLLTERISDIVWTIDLSMRTTYVSPSIVRSLGFTPEERRMQRPEDMMTPESFERSLAMLVEELSREKEHVAEPNRTITIELEYYHKDGSTVWLENKMSAIRDEAGQVVEIQGISRDISDRKRAEEALRDSEQRYSSLLNSTPDLAFLKDEASRYVMINRACLEFFGRAESEILGNTDFELMPHDYAENCRLSDLEAFGGDGPVIDEEVIDGRVYEVKKFGVMLESGKKGIGGLIREVTERKETERALRESEQKYRLLIDHVQEAIFVAQDGMLKFLNPKAIELIEYAESDLLSKPFTEFIHPDDRKMVSENHIKRLQGKDFQDPYMFRIIHSSGAIRWVELNGVVIEWEGRPATLAFLSDITDRKNSEKALRQSEERYRTLVENLNDVIFSADMDGTLTYVSPVFERRSKYTCQEVIGKRFTDFVHPDDLEVLNERYKRVMDGDLAPSEYRLIDKDGTIFHVLAHSRPIYREGKVVGLTGLMTDITERKRAEVAIRESEKRFRTLLEDVSSVSVQGYDQNRTAVFWNYASERLYGYSKDEALGRNLEDLIIPPALRSEVIEAVTNWMEKGERIAAGELQLMHKDGSLVPVYSSHVMLENSRGEKEMYCVDLDLAELKKAEEERSALRDQLREAQKMEAIGTLAGGIAHDFNNLLQVTLGYAEVILADKPEGDPERADLEKIKQAALSGAELVKGLLTFSRRVKTKPTPMNLNTRIAQIEPLLRRTIPRMIEMRFDLAPDLKRTNVDPAQIEQILVNLVINARDAMPGGGVLTLGTRNVTLEEDVFTPTAGYQAGEYVLLYVSDTGHGMDRETRERIFEPFYTTKELGRGTGLGLAVVYGIVQQHHGCIRCHSTPERGTTFRIYFRAITDADEPEKPESAPIPMFGTETVLLVDDERDVRELGNRILTKAGYKVLAAENGNQAIEVFRREQDEISLVVLDLIMPEMGGTDCLREILSIDPQAKVLIASGHAADAAREECLALGAGGFVVKPFRLLQLLEQVRKTLDQR
jgi:PAS domain S-box-containing protein